MVKILYAPTPDHTNRVFRPETHARLKRLFEVEENLTGGRLTTEDIVARIPGKQALVTGWGTPRLSDAVFEAAQDLEIISHSAGSVRAFLDDGLVERHIAPRGIVVFSANGAIALNVAEATIGLLIMTSRQWVGHIQHTATPGGWTNSGHPREGQFLCGAMVGVISASKVGLEVIRMLKPFDVRILLYDPYVTEERARELGVELVELNELFGRSDHVTVHTPNLDETRHMIGAEQLALLRDGGALVNTARGAVIDEEALVAECKRRRLYVALDVTDPEPPLPDSELRSLPNVYITPHIAGSGDYGYFRIGEWAVRALEDYFAGRPVEGAVDFSRFAQIA